MVLEEIIKEELLQQKIKYSSKEFSNFLNSQSYEYKNKDPKKLRKYTLLFLGGFYAAKESLRNETKQLDETQKRMYYSAISATNLINKLEGEKDLIPRSFKELNFATSDYESNLRILRSYSKNMEEQPNNIDKNTKYFFTSLNNFLLSNLSTINKELLKKIQQNTPQKKEINNIQKDTDIETISFTPTYYDDIIGNKEIKDDLTLSMKKLFLYNEEKKKNPALEKLQFKQHYLLAGEPGNGKGMLSAYAATLGTDISKKTNKNLKIISMESNSTYQDGPIIKLLKYLDKITKSDELYLVLLDEIDSAFSSRTDKKTDNYQKKLVTELLKFTSNSIEYINKGNYILIAMTNNPSQLDPAFLNRMNKGFYVCEGPKTKQEKITLMKNLLENYVPKEKLKIKDWKQAGNIAYKLGLSGREIKGCVENLFDNNSTKKLSLDLYNKKFEEQLLYFDEFKPLTQEKLLDELLKTGKKRSIENYLMKGGYVAET